MVEVMIVPVIILMISGWIFVGKMMLASL